MTDSVSNWTTLSDSEPESDYPESEPESEFNFLEISVPTPQSSIGSPETNISRNKMTKFESDQKITKINNHNHKICTKTIKNVELFDREVKEWNETEREIEKLADINNNFTKKDENIQIENIQIENEKLRQDSLNKYSRMMEIYSEKIEVKTQENRKLELARDELKDKLFKIEQLYAMKSAGEQNLQLENNSLKSELEKLKKSQGKNLKKIFEKPETTDFGMQTDVFAEKTQAGKRPRVLVQTRSQTSRSTEKNNELVSVLTKHLTQTNNNRPNNSLKNHVHFANTQKSSPCKNCVSLRKYEIKLSRAENELIEAKVYGKKMLLENLKLKDKNTPKETFSADSSNYMYESSD